MEEVQVCPECGQVIEFHFGICHNCPPPTINDAYKEALEWEKEQEEKKEEKK